MRVVSDKPLRGYRQYLRAEYNLSDEHRRINSYYVYDLPDPVAVELVKSGVVRIES